MRTDANTSEFLNAGARIEFRRRRRRMSRRLVADLVGRSEEWLRLVEKGKLRLDSIQTIIRLAEVLQIEDFRDLIESPPPRQLEPLNYPIRDLLEPLRPIIIGHPGLGFPAPSDGQMPEHYNEQWAATDIKRCEDAWMDAPDRYTLLAQRLPMALLASHAAHWQAQSQATRNTLLRVYHIAAQFLIGLGAHDLAAVVSGRALSLAHPTDPASLVAASGWHWATALLHLGERRGCVNFALSTADSAALDLSAKDDMVLYGALYLLAAKAAADTSPTESTRLMATSHELARPLGMDLQARGIRFGANEIGLTCMEIAFSRRNFSDIIKAASDTVAIEALRPGQRSVYYVTLAAAYIGRREKVSATFALTQAAQACPDEIRYNPRAHGVLRRLVESRDRLLLPQISYLTQLAELR